MSGDDLEPMHDELSALLQQERQREPVSAQVSTRIRDHVAASVGLGVGLGVASAAKAAAASSAKAAASATTASTALGTASVVMAPKTLFVVGAVLFAGGLSTVVATKVWTRSPGTERSDVVGSRAPQAQPTVSRDAVEPVVPAVSEPVVQVEARPETAPAYANAETKVAVPDRAEPAQAPATSRDHDLASERALIEQARQAVAFRRWEAALSSLDQHGRKFSRGRLAEERESLRVPVLVMLGRHEDARTAGKRFHARYPASIFTGGVDQALRSIP